MAEELNILIQLCLSRKASSKLVMSRLQGPTAPLSSKIGWVANRLGQVWQGEQKRV